jgi:hypothetical protein
MFITVINDCKSENDIGRQSTRYSWLFPGANINFVGVNSNLGINSTLEAAGNLIDILDASDGREGIIAMNVAPRGQIKEDGDNGSKFSYFWYKKTLVVSTVKGYNLSLVKKFGLVKHINVLETESVLNFAVNQKLITKDLAEYIKNTQFRSFDYQPRVARWLMDRVKLPYSPISLNKFADAPDAVWLVDSFGNVKTTILRNYFKNANWHTPLKIKTNIGNFPYYERLKLVPDGVTALYTGSSGIGNQRFIEIATQDRIGSVAKRYNLQIGTGVQIYF